MQHLHNLVTKISIYVLDISLSSNADMSMDTFQSHQAQ